jgi:DnaJ-class molecular chaperone
MRMQVAGQPEITELDYLSPGHSEARTIRLCDQCGGAGVVRAITDIKCSKCEGYGRLIETVTTIVNPYRGR